MPTLNTLSSLLIMAVVVALIIVCDVRQERRETPGRHQKKSTPVIQTNILPDTKPRHVPQNVNLLHEAEQATASLNMRFAVWLTKRVGDMWTAYAFAFLALIGLLGILGILPPIIVLLVQWFSQTFLQLVFLPILSVGQSVLSRHQELQAEEVYHHMIQVNQDADAIKARQDEHSAQLGTLVAQMEGMEDRVTDHVVEQLMVRLAQMQGSPTLAGQPLRVTSQT